MSARLKDRLVRVPLQLKTELVGRKEPPHLRLGMWWNVEIQKVDVLRQSDRSGSTSKRRETPDGEAVSQAEADQEAAIREDRARAGRAVVLPSSVPRALAAMPPGERTLSARLLECCVW